MVTWPVGSARGGCGIGSGGSFGRGSPPWTGQPVWPVVMRGTEGYVGVVVHVAVVLGAEVEGLVAGFEEVVLQGEAVAVAAGVVDAAGEAVAYGEDVEGSCGGEGLAGARAACQSG